jgi:hypothetical protein
MLDQKHLSEEDLLLTADGEMPFGQAHRICTHLARCKDCRRVLKRLEFVSADLAFGHRETLDPAIPSIQGPRALLRARMAEAAQALPFWRRIMPSFGWASVAAAAAITVMLIALANRAAHTAPSGGVTAQAALVVGLVPNQLLTPGATRPISMSEVCSVPHEEVIKDVSASERASVFEEYGIQNVRAGDYEVDYLIAPGLGGTDDIHNLWPEPYRAGTWDAHAKDALEERLHQLVCARKVDLLTAQRAIAGDWISAYKKYLRTDTPQYVARVSEAPRALHNRGKYQAG